MCSIGKLFEDLMENGDEVYDPTCDPLHPGRGIVLQKREYGKTRVLVRWATGDHECYMSELNSWAYVAARGTKPPLWEFPFEAGDLFGVYEKADLLELEGKFWCGVNENWTVKVKGQKWQWIVSPLCKFRKAEENVGAMLAR